MSYYTGASERSSVPLRLRIAVRADKFDDIEMRQFVSRDLWLLAGVNQRTALAGAYNDASPVGRNFIEQILRDIDPSAIDLMRSGV